jgi:hypothetical protein
MSGDPDDRYGEEPQMSPRAFAAAREAVRVPAILLIIVGVLSAAMAAFNLVSLPTLPAQFDQAIEDIDNDPNMPAADKEKFKDFFSQAKEMSEQPALWAVYGVMGVIALVILFGGVKLLNLSGPALPIISAVLAMIPCTSGCCCVIGLPVGIWTLIVVNRPNVRAAMAASRFGPPPQIEDDQYMR